MAGVATVRQATAAEYPQVAGVMGKAFADDPIVSWVYRGRNVAPKLSKYTSALLRTVGHRREVWVSEGFDGAAIWAPPGEFRIGGAEIFRMMTRMFGAFGRPSAMPANLAVEKLHPEEPHWYLELLGTVPERQGHGLGAAVLKPVLDRCDEEGIPAWAWSSNRRNLGFYYRHGFEVLEERPFTKGAPPIFPIRREPRPPEL
jgi:ribosomal protein S18 acetylase RimI-like enzyme